MSKRKNTRITKRLETLFSSGDLQYRGISSDLSENGLFIRTQNGFVPGTPIDIEVYLPNNSTCQMRGVVRRTVKNSLSLVKNGMGVEIVGGDPCYFEFLRSIGCIATGCLDNKAESPAAAAVKKTEETVVVTCPLCNTKNRVPAEKLPLRPRCGRCGVPIDTESTAP